MASLPSPHLETAVPPSPLENTPAPPRHDIDAVFPGPGSSADSYNDDEELAEKKLGYGKETGALEAGGQDAKKESFLRKKRELNPLRWQPIPPVPETQSPSAEAEAGFFSKLTLSWIGPLMRVRYISSPSDYTGALLTPPHRNYR